MNRRLQPSKPTRRLWRWSAVFLLIAAPACMNARPGAPVVTIEPAEPYGNDDLEMVVVTEAEDADGSVLFYRTVWTRDGSQVAELDDRTTVPAELTRRGEEWLVDVVAIDSDLEAGERAEAAVEIGNYLPLLAVSISPSPAPSHRDLVAIVESSDADDDPVTVSTAWSVDGIPRSDLTDALRVPAEQTLAGETWMITATASDGADEGEAVSAQVVVVDDLRPPGSALCAGAGRVANGEAQGVLCTAPLELASTPASNDQLKWYPGPIQRITP